MEAMSSHEGHKEQARDWGVLGREDRMGQGREGAGPGGKRKINKIGEMMPRLDRQTASDPCGS